MKKNLLFLFSLISLIIYSCSSTNKQAGSSTVYYICLSDTVLVVYQYANSDIPVGFIPENRQFIIKNINDPYPEIQIGVNKGFIKKRTVKVLDQFLPNRLSDYAYNHDDSTYTYIKGYSKGKNKASPEVTSSGGTVQVKGYYRKDGTYVKPHTRSAPRKKN